MPHPGQAGSGAARWAGNLVFFLDSVFIGLTLVWLFDLHYFLLVVDAPSQGITCERLATSPKLPEESSQQNFRAIQNFRQCAELSRDESQPQNSEDDSRNTGNECESDSRHDQNDPCCNDGDREGWALRFLVPSAMQIREPFARPVVRETPITLFEFFQHIPISERLANSRPLAVERDGDRRNCKLHTLAVEKIANCLSRMTVCLPLKSGYSSPTHEIFSTNEKGPDLVIRACIAFGQQPVKLSQPTWFAPDTVTRIAHNGRKTASYPGHLCRIIAPFSDQPASTRH